MLDKPVRLVLFSYYGNHVVSDGQIAPWDPKTMDEISAVPLEVVRALGQHGEVDSMLCFSMGAFALDGLRHISPEKADLIPKTLILNRGLTSIWKVTSHLHPYLRWLYYPLAYLSSFDANPEGQTVSFFERLANHANGVGDRRVVAFEMVKDSYFSGEASLDSDFASRLADLGVRVDYGRFSMPLMAEEVHHSCRIDWVLNTEDGGGDTSSFLNIRPNESVARALAREVITEGDSHTCLVVGGRLDTLGTLTYGNALPILEALVMNHSSSSLGYGSRTG